MASHLRGVGGCCSRQRGHNTSAGARKRGSYADLTLRVGNVLLATMASRNRMRERTADTQHILA